MQSLKFYIDNPRVFGFSLLDKFGYLFSDKLYLQLLYYFRMGKKLHLKHPRTFNEKLQWLKLYDRRSEYTVMVDKVKAKEYVALKIGEEYIIPTLGVWEDPDEIDFDALPNQFVLKCNHSSGGLCICTDKSQLDISKVKEDLRKGLRDNYYLHGREWPHKNVPRRILAEKFMMDESDEGDLILRGERREKTDLRDYKFFCFDGEPRLCQVISDRTADEKIDFYDMNWHRIIGLIGLSENVHNSDDDILCPRSYNKMKQMARVLSKDLPFSRIDFYEINGNPYFGEITFYPACGFGEFRPNEWNTTIGEWVHLPIGAQQ